MISGNLSKIDLTVLNKFLDLCCQPKLYVCARMTSIIMAVQFCHVPLNLIPDIRVIASVQQVVVYLILHTAEIETTQSKVMFTSNAKVKQSYKK